MLSTETSSAPSSTAEGGRTISTLVSSFVSVRTMEQFVAVVGPPAVGKSTVTGRFGGRVFRLREFAQEFRSRPDTDQRLFDTSDPLGWLPEETVFLLLRAALLFGQFPGRGMVVLENFPGSLTQLLALTAIAEQRRAPLTLIELTAADNVVAARARTRRVCLTCEPDPHGDPHRPALGTTCDPDRCDSCAGGILPRRGDEPQRFAARLARFRRRIPAIRRAATVLHLPYRAVDATGDPETCLQGVTTALAATEQLAHVFASRREHF